MKKLDWWNSLSKGQQWFVLGTGAVCVGVLSGGTAYAIGTGSVAIPAAATGASVALGTVKKVILG